VLRRKERPEAHADSWLVVGVGNPDSEYAGTRHNVGSDTVRLLASRLGVSLKNNRRVRCEIAEAMVGGARLVLTVPHGYMNEAGGPVQSAARWYRIPPERIVVLHDELDLPVATVRLKQGGGTAGHNGLRDIEARLGSREFHRVRIGIGKPPGRMAGKDHVLRRFTAPERREVDVALVEAADAVLGIVRDGLEPTQNRVHQPRPT